MRIIVRTSRKIIENFSLLDFQGLALTHQTVTKILKFVFRFAELFALSPFDTIPRLNLCLFFAKKDNFTGSLKRKENSSQG